VLSFKKAASAAFFCARYINKACQFEKSAENSSA